MKDKTSLDLFEDLLSALACWKKVSDKDYQTLETIYYKLLGKKQRTALCIAYGPMTKALTSLRDAQH